MSKKFSNIVYSFGNIPSINSIWFKKNPTTNEISILIYTEKGWETITGDSKAIDNINNVIEDLKSQLNSSSTETNELKETIKELETINNQTEEKVKSIEKNINDIKSSVSSAYKIKGSKTIAELGTLTLTEDNIGDVYNILNKGTIDGIKLSKGDNVVYTAEGWDKLAASIDVEDLEEVFIKKDQGVELKGKALIIDDNGFVTPVEGVIMQQAERDKLASLQVNAIPSKIQSENSFVETDGDTIKAFGNKLQSGRFPDTSNSENLLVVGNGNSQDSTSNALELTYNGELIAQTDVVVGENKLTEKLDINDLPSASKGIGIFDIEGEEIFNGVLLVNNEVVELNENEPYNLRNITDGLIIEFVFDYKIDCCEKIELQIRPFNNYNYFDIKNIKKGDLIDWWSPDNAPVYLQIYLLDINSNSIKIKYVSNNEFNNTIYKPKLKIKPQKHYQLSLSDKTDNQPFGYNPAKDEWQTLEAVKEVNELPEVKENVVYNLKEYKQIGKSYEEDKVVNTSYVNMGRIYSYEKDSYPLNKGYFLLEVTNSDTNESESICFKNNWGITLNPYSASFETKELKFKDITIFFAPTPDSNNLNLVDYLNCVIRANIQNKDYINIHIKVSLVEVDNKVFSKDIKLLTDIQIATNDDVEELFSLKSYIIDFSMKKYYFDAENELNKSDIINIVNNHNDLVSEIHLGNKITSIADNSLQRFPNLTKFILSKNIESIGIAAFAYCGKLTEIEIPAKTKVIKQAAFIACTSLSKVTINGLDTEILEQAFRDCPESGTLYCHQEWYDNLSDAEKTNLETLVNWEKVWLN